MKKMIALTTVVILALFTLVGCETIQDMDEAINQPAEIAMPASSDELEGQHYRDVVEALQNVGFDNVEARRMDDLITGWVNKEGTVDSISVNGKMSFDDGQLFPENAEIVVKYHSFKDKKTSSE